MMSDKGLDSIAQYAAGIGPHKRDILKGTHPGVLPAESLVAARGVLAKRGLPFSCQ